MRLQTDWLPYTQSKTYSHFRLRAVFMECGWVQGQKADGRMALSVVADERASCAFSLDRP